MTWPGFAQTTLVPSGKAEIVLSSCFTESFKLAIPALASGKVPFAALMP